MATELKYAGFIGLGNIGKPMAQSLLKGDFGVWVYDVFPEAADSLVEEGANKAASIAEVAAHCEVIGLCVRDDNDVKNVMAEILENPGVCKAVAVHSTVTPETIREQAELASAKSIGVIDAPITGGSTGAANGTLCYIVGGPEETLELCRPAFETSAKEIVHAGDLGMGMIAKLCNNLMTYAEFITFYEAMRLAEAAGLNTDVVKQVGAANGNITEQMGMFIGLREFKPLMKEDEFEDMVCGVAAVAEKDLSIALDQAKKVNADLKGCEKTLELIGKVYRCAY